MILPSYSAISFDSKESHLAALYDACKLIIDTYDQCDILDDVAVLMEGSSETYVLPSDVALFAKEVLHRISENKL